MDDKNSGTISRWLSAAAHVADLGLEQKLRPLGVNTSQFFFILKIAENPKITQDQLIKTDFLHQSNVTREISQLVDKGLVNKVRSTSDKRKFVLTLTEEGDQLCPKIQATLDAHEAQIAKLIEANSAQFDKDRFVADLREITKLNRN